eukprot:Awhi_evm1s10347
MKLDYLKYTNAYLSGYSSYGSQGFSSLDAAQNRCNVVSDCSGVTQRFGTYTLRGGSLYTSASLETSWLK